MKISEFIELLKSAKDKHGDVEVWCTHEWSAPVEEEYDYSPEQNLDDHKDYFPEAIYISPYGEYDHRGEWDKRHR